MFYWSGFDLSCENTILEDMFWQPLYLSVSVIWYCYSKNGNIDDCVDDKNDNRDNHDGVDSVQRAVGTRVPADMYSSSFL